MGALTAEALAAIMSRAVELAAERAIAKESAAGAALVAIEARRLDVVTGAKESGESAASFEAVRDYLLEPLKALPRPAGRYDGDEEFAYLEEHLFKMGSTGGLAELALRELKRWWARMVPIERVARIITGLAQDLIYGRVPESHSVGTAAAWFSRQALERLLWAQRSPQRQVPLKALEKLLGEHQEIYEAIMQHWQGGQLMGEAAIRETLSELRRRLQSYTFTSASAEQA